MIIIMKDKIEEITVPCVRREARELHIQSIIEKKSNPDGLIQIFKSLKKKTVRVKVYDSFVCLYCDHYLAKGIFAQEEFEIEIYHIEDYY